MLHITYVSLFLFKFVFNIIVYLPDVNCFTSFCSSVHFSTIINLYVHLLPVTDDGHNNTKQSTSNSTTENKNDQKEDETGENDDDALLDNVYG